MSPNPVANCLSLPPPSPPVPMANLSLDFTILSSAQLLCDQVKSLASDPRLKVKEVGPQGLLCDFGVPAHLTSDCGPQFVLALWKRLCAVLGIFHHQTTAYHPESNGMVERFNRSLKNTPVPGAWAPFGTSTFPGSSWGSGPPPRRGSASLLQRWCLTPHCASLGSSLRSLNLRRTPFSPISARLSSLSLPLPMFTPMCLHRVSTASSTTLTGLKYLLFIVNLT